MNFHYLRQLLSLNAERIRVLVEGTGAEEARFRPSPGSWSMLEVVNHLYDEERADFRVRLDIMLNRPDESWPPINPQGWVMERRYNERDPVQSLAAFLDERRASLRWLESLGEPDWERTAPAPWGEMRVGDMFAAWVAHDQLHMRQLVEIQRALLLREVAPFDPQYAGDW